jgi:hypothetical protein
MLNQFFALGGVTNLKDFYAKFPTEAHFDRHIKKLKKGGTVPRLKKYQGDKDGSTVIEPPTMPKREDYFTGATTSGMGLMEQEEAYNAAMDEYNAKAAEYQKYVEEENKKKAATTPTAQTTTAQTTSAAGSGTTTTNEPKTKLNPYTGGSLVDFLKTQDKASSRQSRKQLADKLGIVNYTGTASQNNQILKSLRENPGLLDDYQDEQSNFDENTYVAPRRSGSSGSSGNRNVSPDPGTTTSGIPGVGRPRGTGTGYGNAPGGGAAPGASNQQPVDDQGNPIPWEYIIPGAGLAGYGAYEYFRPRYYPYTAPINDPSRLLRGPNYPGAPTGATGPKLPPGTTPKQITVGNSRSLPGGTTNVPKGLPGPGGDDIVQSITKRGSYTVDELRQLMKVNPKRAQEIASSFPKFVPTNVAANAVSGAPKTVPYKASAAKVGWMDEAARGIGNAYRAVRTGSKFKNAGNLLRFFSKFDQGGEMDELDMMHYYGANPNYAYGGNYGYGGYHAYGSGGGYPRYDDGGEGGPGWGDVAWGAVQMLDPTGITSWYDAGKAIGRAWDNPTWGNVGSALLETAGALPIVGKVGKAVKGAGMVVDAAKVASKPGVVKRVVNSAGKVVDYVDNSKVGKVLQPVKKIDNAKWNKVAQGVKENTARLAAKSPKAGAVLNVASPFNRAARFNSGFNPLINMGLYHADKAAGIAPGQVFDQNQNYKEDGGTYSAGVYYDQGGSFIPSYADSAYGLPKFGMGAVGVPTAMYGMGMRNGGPVFSNHTGYPHQDYVPALDWMQDGGMMQEQQAAPPQQGGGIDPQQVMQMVAEMLQQGAQPDQIMQQLVQMGVPQEMAQQIIQQVMQEMQGGQPQDGGQSEQQFQVGGEYNLSQNDIQKLIAQGYQIEYL